jgi:cadherin 5 type 2 (VE-cadherin)
MEFRFLERITLHEDHVKNLRNIESADFKKLNRHQEVLPFKHSQVRLKFEDDGKFLSEDNRQLKHYINANYINGIVRGMHEKSMIACQAPNDASLPRFWRMIWQNKVKLLVMLCPLKSKKSKKKDDQQNDEQKEDDWKEESTNYWMDLQQVGDTAQIEKEFTLKLLSL